MPIPPFLIALAAKLADMVVQNGLPLLGGAIFNDNVRRAVQRVYSKAFACMLAETVADEDEAMQRHLGDLLAEFIQKAQVSGYLLRLVLDEEAPPLDELRTAFEELEYDPETIDLEEMLVALHRCLEEEASEEARQPESPLSNTFTVSKLQLIRADTAAILREIKRIRQELRRLQPAELPRRIACNQVPRPPHFAGRENELKTLSEALNGDGKIAITTAALAGVGGIGKTTLAQGFVYHAEGQFGLKLWASLGEYATAEIEPRILKEWMEFAGKPLPEGLQLVDMRTNTRLTLAELVQSGCGEPVLLVLDNVWQDTLPIAKVLREKVVPANAQVLLTTRSDEIASELEIPCIDLHYLSPGEGAALVMERLGKENAAMAERLRPQLEKMSEILGGHPLALALMALHLTAKQRLLNETGLTALSNTLQTGMESGEPFKDLQLDQGDTKDRSVSVSLWQTIRTLGDGDLELQLFREEQFRALGVLPVEVPVRTAHLWALWGKEDEAALDEFLAEGLLDLVADPANPGMFKVGLYRQHRLLRAYARSLLREKQELVLAWARHTKYVIEVAENGFRHPPELWSALEDDLPQIIALGNELAKQMSSFAPSLSHQNIDTGTTSIEMESEDARETLRKRIEPGLWELLNGDPRLLATPPYVHIESDTKGHRLIKANPDLDEQLYLLSHKPPTNIPVELLTLCSAFVKATWRLIFGRYIGLEGRRWLWAGLAAIQALNFESGAPLLMGELGNLYLHHGYYDVALSYFGRALAANGVQRFQAGQAINLDNIGRVYTRLGEFERALTCLNYALKIPTSEDTYAIILNNIGQVYLGQEKLENALSCFKEALRILRSNGNLGDQAAAHNNIGAIYKTQSRLDRAYVRYHRALQLYREVGDLVGEGSVLTNIGELCALRGRVEEERSYYEDALQLFRIVGDRRSEATLLNNIGLSYSETDTQKAMSYLQMALKIHEELKNRPEIAGTYFNIAMCLSQMGQINDAIDQMQTSRDLRAAMGLSTYNEDYILAMWRRITGG